MADLRQSRKKLIVDTDPGIDDAMALKFASASPELDVLAVTACFGNAEEPIAAHNALRLCRRFGIAAPVHRGAAAPLSIPRNPSPVHVHGRDGLGDAGFAQAPATGFAREPADAAIARLVREHPGQIVLVAMAPLTNLALALRRDPGIAAQVREVVVMGGAFGHGGRHGNVTPFAEANVWNDPHAAQDVFAAPWPVTVVGLDVTMRCVLDAAASERLAREGGEDARYLHAISRRYEAIYRQREGIAGCCLHDVAAMACALRPELFRSVAGKLGVTTSGAAIGQTRLMPDAAARHRVCIDVEADALLRLYGERLRQDHRATTEAQA